MLSMCDELELEPAGGGLQAVKGRFFRSTMLVFDLGVLYPLMCDRVFR